ncbi:hypothetical protein GB937_001464 [Aspergillus fischeri]|nr:hypothetical protein GB937_001464 [Aspergillus fischeri]
MPTFLVPIKSPEASFLDFDEKLCWLNRDPGMGLNALLSSYEVGAERPLSTVKMQLLNRARKSFQHITRDVHCCCVLCAFLDKVYARLFVPYGNQSAPPGSRGPSP